VFYLRLVGRSTDIYQYLEPLYNDYRKLRIRKTMGWEVIHVDELVRWLLKEVRVVVPLLICDLL
jgi:pre-mRNA-splicing factor 38A